VIDMATEKKTPVSYPFVTKAQIKARLDADPEYRKEVIVTLYQLQTEDEQESGSTRHSNRYGFMSSHAVNGSRLAVKIQAGEPLTEKDHDLIDAIAPRYSRQLATLAREEAIVADPSLKSVAAVFGVAKG
jgi:hypothetical protein